jgi:CBS-domain-containing membrane protein
MFPTLDLDQIAPGTQRSQREDDMTVRHRTAFITVWEVMSPSPMTVTPETSLRTLVDLFERHDFNAIPVVNSERVLCGLVTKVDLLRLLRPDAEFRLPDFSEFADDGVQRIMRRGVVTVEPDDLAAAAADLMVTTGLRSLPVVERKSGRPVLVGMLSRGDLLRGLEVETGMAPGRGAADG